MRWIWRQWPWSNSARDPRVTPGDDHGPWYDPPSRYALQQWDAAQRAADFRAVFDGEVGQRVLYDILHNICGIGGNPRATLKGPRGEAGFAPDPNGVLLSGNVGKQEVGYAILETLTIPLGSVIEGNRRKFQ